MVDESGGRRRPAGARAGALPGAPSLAQMFALAPAFLALVRGPEHRFVEANSAFLRLVGRENILGRPLHDALPEVREQGFLEILDDVYRSGEPYTAEEALVHLQRTGGELEPRHMSFAYQPLRDEAGAVNGILIHGVDVTAHVTARVELEEREAYYRALLEHSHDKVSVIAPDGRILFESAALTRLLGFTEVEVVGRNVAELIHPDDQAAAFEQMRRAAAQPGKAHRQELRLRHRDGTWRHFEAIGHARGANGHTELVINSRDITDRREAEERARRSDERFRTLADSSPDGFMLFRSVRDAAGRIVDFEWLYTNPAGAAVAGLTHEDLLGRRLLEEMPGKARDGLFDAYVQVVETGTPWTRELTYAHDGINHACRAQAVRVDDGFGVTVSDMSASHRAREELREREARFRALVELIPQLVWSTTPDGYHDYFNRRWYEYTGMAPTGQQGWNWKDYLHPDDSERTLEAWHRCLRTGEPYQIEYRFRRHDGEYRWFAGRALPLRDASGAIERWFGTCTDVHDERMALESAQASEARFNAVIHATNDVVWEWDFETDRVWWNENLEHALRFSAGQMPHTLDGWRERIHPEDADRVVESVNTAIAQEHEVWTSEYRFIRGDGTLATVLDRGMLVRDSAGNPVRMLGSMLDMTDRIRLEAELRQAHKMEAIGNLAGGIAHDFNNLLTVITSYSEVLLSDLPADSPARADICEVRGAANRASSLTRQLLAFSRRQLLQPRQLDLNDVVADIQKLLERVIGETIHFEFQAGETGAVFADPGQVEQVIVNLAVNARDAMPGGGTLTVSTSSLRDAGSEFAMISVADTGVGMDEDTLAHAFEPFFTTKPPGKGTGLGLSTVHGIVTQSGGRIEVDSAPGQGSTFRVILPATRGGTAPAAAAAPAGTATVRRGAAIVVVEDEAAVRAIARRTLARNGYTVHEAADGNEALEVLERLGPAVDLVLSDLVMPGMGGRELARRLRERPGSPPILFMSGYAEDNGAGGALESDARVLEKPFTMRQLLDGVAAAMEQPVD